MTILDAILCMTVTFCIGYFVCVIYLAAPLLQHISRLIGKLNQKDYDIMRWQLAYNKTNNDFMSLAETQQSEVRLTTKQEDSGWIDWTYSEATPYPLTLDTIVDVKFGDGEVFENESVGYWQASGINVEGDCWTKRENVTDTIVAYRVVN